MKTLLQLRDEGLLSVRLQHTIARNSSRINNLFNYGGRLDHIRGNWISYGEFMQLTVRDLFDLFGEDGIARWYGMGPKRLEELKGLL